MYTSCGLCARSKLEILAAWDVNSIHQRPMPAISAIAADFMPFDQKLWLYLRPFLGDKTLLFINQHHHCHD
jgi:hypothetical protein